MRVAVLLVCVALAACSFKGHGGDGVTDGAIDSPIGVIDAAIDGAVDADVDALIDAPPIDANSTSCSVWCRRKPITIHQGKVNGAHTNFPVLVRLGADAELAAEARNDGFDIRFTDGNGVVIPYERATFDGATGRLEAWVKVPSLSGTVDTTIYLAFGNANATDQQARTQVWSAPYQGVWHLDEAAGGTNAIKDATGNGNDGTNQNGVAFAAAGQFGTGVSFDGVDDMIQMANSTSLDLASADGTFGVWLKWTTAIRGQYQLVMSSTNRYSGPDGFEWASQGDGDHYFYPWGGDGSDYNLGASPYTNGVYQYAVVTFKSATKEVAIYVNGTAMPFIETNVPTHWTQVAAPAGWMWGGNPGFGSASSFLGSMDEIRVASVARNAGWIATEYNNQSSPATFYAVGAAETLP